MDDIVTESALFAEVTINMQRVPVTGELGKPQPIFSRYGPVKRADVTNLYPPIVVLLGTNSHHRHPVQIF